jgi:hypothetical protein
MPRGLVIALAAGLVVAVAVFEGLRSNRWGASADLQVAAAKLERIPREFGEWVGTDSQLDRKVVDMAEAVGYVNRSYVSRKTQERFDVLLLCGASGPIGAHTPDVCYGGLGYKCVGKPTPKRVVIGNGASSFWTARFEKATPTDDPLRVFWGWSIAGDWEAAESPRTAYALTGALYKMNVARRESAADRARSPDTPDPDEAFLTEFLPVVKKALTEDPG